MVQVSTGNFKTLKKYKFFYNSCLFLKPKKLIQKWNEKNITILVWLWQIDGTCDCVA